MKNIIIKIRFSARQLYFSFFLIAFINIFFLFGTSLCNTIDWTKKSYLTGFLLRESNLAWENTTATWYSSMLLLLASITAIICFQVDKKIINGRYEHILNRGWIMICLIFAVLSLDEIGSIHESLGKFSFFNRFGIHEALLSNAFYALILLVGSFMAIFGFFRFKNNKWAILFGVLGVLLFLTVPLQERLEWSHAVWDVKTDSYDRGYLSIIIEEGTEIFGSLCFIICLFQYLIVSQKKNAPNKNYVINTSISINTKTLLINVILIIGFFSLLDIFIQHEFFSIKRMDNGIPENWFPSAAAFVTSLISFYLYSDNKRKQNGERKGYLLFSIFTLLTSDYFGSNLFNRISEKGGGLPTAPNILLLVICVFVGLELIWKNKSALTRIGIVLWIISFSSIFIFFNNEHATISFFAFCVLNLFFFIDVFKSSTRVLPTPL